MTGGELQLASYGEQDHYLSGNPQISYFRMVYRRYTNFAMDSFEVDFNDTNISVDNTTTLTCKIPHHGDLITNMYFKFTLPKISKDPREGSVRSWFSGATAGFQWIENIGNNIINKVSITIGHTLIDTIYGEWMNIWHQIRGLTDTKYNKLIGNINNINMPEYGDKSTFGPGYYPTRVDAGSSGGNVSVQETKTTSIESYIVTTPLIFWFNRNPGLALPLISLYGDDVILEIELKPVRELYTLMDSPNRHNGVGAVPGLYRAHFKPPEGVIVTNIGRFLTPPVYSYLTSLDIQAHLEINYIFLSEREKTRFATVEHEYLIETNWRKTITDIYTTSVETKLELNKPVKELIWIARRNDMVEVNQYDNYTNWKHPDICPWSTRTSNSASGWRNNSEFRGAGQYMKYVGTLPHPQYADSTDNNWDTGRTEDDASNFIRENWVLLQPAIAEQEGFDGTVHSKKYATNMKSVLKPYDVEPSNYTIAGGTLYYYDPNGQYSYIHQDYNAARIDSYWNFWYTYGDGDNMSWYDSPRYTPDYKYLHKEIITSTKITLNGLERINKDNIYFQNTQPVQHYKSQGRDGIHLYSFSLNPNEYQPSGACNMARVGNINISFTLNPPLPNERHLKESYVEADVLKNNSGKTVGDGTVPGTAQRMRFVWGGASGIGYQGEYWYGYDIHIYAISYNILRISGGTANLAFY